MKPSRSRVSQRSGAPPLRVVTDDEPTVEELLADAEAAERQARHADARALYERALSRIREQSQAPLASSLLRWIARSHHAEGANELALEILDVAQTVAQLVDDPIALGHAVNLHAAILFQQGDLDRAEALYQQARSLALLAGEPKLAAMTGANLGVIANVRGDLQQALQHYETSLADYRALGLARDVCIALNNLGLLYTDLHRWDAAERAYDEAMQISTVLGDLSARVLIEVNVAELCVARGAYEQARDACTRAMELSTRLNDPRALGDVEKVHGVVAREQGAFDEAEAHFERAERVAVEREDLLLAAETAREKAELHRRQARNRDMLQCLNRAHRLFSQLRARRDIADVDRRTTRLEGEFVDVVRRWGDSIESKDRYTQGHCERVADIACALARRTGMDDRSLFWFRIGALLHDVGKLVIPAEVLNRPGKLSDEEWALVRRHPEAGVEMLAEIEFPWDVRPIVESHHERWDGRGYPHGLAGEAIPVTARILCIADVYDALTSDRAYKRALPHEAAMDVMRADAGKHFDPALFAKFDELFGTGALERPSARNRPLTATPRPDAQPDDLTGLPLRREFMDAASEALRLRAGTSDELSLLVVDVDHFKLVNDTYGHLQGDDVLCAVAEALQGELSGVDLLGRYAGDEFVVLLRGADAPTARATAERIRAAVHRLEVPLREAGEGSVGASLSIGFATAPAHGETFDTLFAAADRALYAAKRLGRNAVAGASADGVSVQPRLSIERFVGRAAETRTLARLLELGASGRPALVSVLGEAGVGKSTLLRQLAPEVRVRGGTIVSGRSAEGDLKPPYAPWADVIGALHRQGLVPAREWTELPRLVPALGAPAPARDKGASGKYALLDEITDCVRSAAATSPVVIVLDDMQWADAATWDTLQHLMSRLERERLLVCLTIRAEDSSEETTLRRRSLSRDERVHEIALQRLSEAELGEWLAAVFHREDVATDLLRFLYRQTEGNPFLVVQVLRTLGEEGIVRYANGRWEWDRVEDFALPVAIRDLIARRLERLSLEARRILTTAAVIGRTFDVDAVIAAGGGSEDELLDAIDEGIAASVLEHAASRDGDHFCFTHGLLAEAIRASCNQRRLRRIHLAVAGVLEARRPIPIADVAHHYERAGEAAKAYAYAMQAGDQATAVYAQEEAIGFFSMAERHAADASEALEARLRRAAVLESAGRYEDAEALYERVLEEGGIARLREVVVRRARERVRAQRGQPPARTLAACRMLLAEAEALSFDSERVALLTMISHAHSRLGDWPEATARAREAVELARGQGDDRLHAEALTRLGSVLLSAEPERAIEIYTRAHALFEGVAERHGQARCHINSGIAHARLGDERAAEEAYLAGYGLGVNAHAPDLAGLAALNLGVLLMKGGRFSEAAERYREALRQFTTCRSEPHRLAALYNLAHLAREIGDRDTAVDRYEAAIELAREVGQVDVEAGALAGLGLAALHQRRNALASGALEAMERLLDGRAEWWFQGRELVEALRVRSTLETGDVDGAQEQLEASVALSEEHDLYGAAWLVAECAGPLAAAGAGRIWPCVERFAPRVGALGYAPLSRRYEALLASARG